MNKTGILLAALLALGAAGAARANEGAQFQLSGFNFDSSMVINLVNNAQQTSGAITGYNAGPNAGVVSVTIQNTGTAAGYCYFVPILSQVSAGGYTFSCAGNQLVQGPVLQTVNPIQPGQTIVANLSNIEVAPGQNGYNGTVCMSIQDTFQNSSFSTVANTVLKMTLEACLQQCNVGGSPFGPKTCNVGGPSSFFTQPPANSSSCSLLIDPHNDGVPTNLPNFVWTPAFENGSTANIKYLLVVSETEGGQPWASIQVPQGQTYYQWQASDRAFEPGKKYWYHVISEEEVTNKPVGGQNGSGWNTEKWFMVASALDSGGSGVSTISGQDVYNFYAANAPASVKAVTAGMSLLGETPSDTITDPDFVYLMTHPDEIISISGQKQ
jgi:hypothetical protein